jgi:hypothetical protein
VHPFAEALPRIDAEAADALRAGEQAQGGGTARARNFGSEAVTFLMIASALVG